MSSRIFLNFLFQNKDIFTASELLKQKSTKNDFEMTRKENDFLFEINVTQKTTKTKEEESYKVSVIRSLD